MSKQVKKTDTITITIQGSKRVRQEVVDRLYSAVMEDGLLDDIPLNSRVDSKMTFSSTLQPSE